MKEAWLKRNIKRLRRNQGCLTDCVAYLFNLHPENVPYFVYPRKGWVKRFKAFFLRHGHRVYWIASKSIPKSGLCIVCGNSLNWKTYSHVVVYKNGRLVYDPDYPSKWSRKRMTHRLIITKA